jgi:hypothetical protein
LGAAVKIAYLTVASVKAATAITTTTALAIITTIITG